MEAEKRDPGNEVGRGGAFSLYFRPHPGAFDSLGAPAPGNLPSI